MKSPETIRPHHCYLRADFYDVTDFSAPAAGPSGYYAADQLYVYESPAGRIHCRAVSDPKTTYHDPELGEQWEAYMRERKAHMDGIISEFEQKAKALGITVEFKNCELPYIKNKRHRPSSFHDYETQNKIEEQLIEEYLQQKRKRGELIQDEDFTLLWNCHNARRNQEYYYDIRRRRFPALTHPFTVKHSNGPLFFGVTTDEIASERPDSLVKAVFDLMGTLYENYQNKHIQWAESPMLEGWESKYR